MPDTMAPSTAAVWTDQTEAAFERLGLSAELAATTTDPELGPRLARQQADDRGWHGLHPYVETVIDRAAEAGRVLRSGNPIEVPAADLRSLREWWSGDFSRHLATADGTVEADDRLIALRYGSDDLRFIAALARAPRLAGVLDGEVRTATVSDPALLGDAGLVIEAAANDAHDPTPRLPAGFGVVVQTDSIHHRFGASTGRPTVIVEGAAAVGAVGRIVGAGRVTTHDGGVTVDHSISGEDLLRRLFGTTVRSTPGFNIAVTDGAEASTPVDAVHPMVKLSPRIPTEIEAIANRWVSELTRPEPVRDLRDEAEKVGIDLDLWLVALAAEPAEEVAATVVSHLGERLGWTPLPEEVASVAFTVLEGVGQALSSEGVVDADALARLSAWAKRPGFWSKLAASAVVAEGGLVFPFSGPAIDLLRASVLDEGRPDAMAARLGPLRTAAVRSMGSGR